MDTSTSTLLTGLIVLGGQVSNGKGIDLKIIIAVLFMAIMLSVMGEGNAKFAQKFGLLILVCAVFGYGPAILKSTGLSGSKKK